ncbi:MAG: universal stress protein [Desulfobacterales bacterium]
MRILFVVDQNRYSARIIPQVVRLAMNTWSDITLLGVQPKITTAKNKSTATSAWRHLDRSFIDTLHHYREVFFNCFSDRASPYSQLKYDYQVVEVKRGIYEELLVGRSGQKNFSVRLRPGNPSREILAESSEQESDLIVLGCDLQKACRWAEWGSIPRKVATEAACSVLIVKKEKNIQKILCCLDHDRVSHESLEMINQMVTLFQAELDIVGLTESDSLQENVERKLDWILKYYAARKIRPWIELVPLSSLEKFISREARWGLMALWIGEKSILQKVFSRKTVDRLIQASNSSVLILR